MHELKIIQNIFPLIEKIAKDNHLKKVDKIALGLGELRQIRADFLQFAFDAVAKGTIAEDAELFITMIHIEILCLNCKNRFIVKKSVYVCPNCQGVSFDVLSGKEVVLESIDGEREDDLS